MLTNRVSQNTKLHTPWKRTNFWSSLPRLEKSVRSFAPQHVKGTRTHTRPAYGRSRTFDKPVTLHQCTDTADSFLQHNAALKTRRWNFRNSPAMALKFIYHPPFSDSLIPFLPSILQEKSTEAYFSRASASEGTVFALPLEYMLCWPCQRCVTWVRHGLWGPRHRPGPSARNHRNH